jgi:hypothetical protein
MGHPMHWTCERPRRLGEWLYQARIIAVLGAVGPLGPLGRTVRAEQAVATPPAAVIPAADTDADGLRATELRPDTLRAGVLAADDARIAALTSGDAEALAEWLADDLRYVHSFGSVDTKDSFLELVRSGTSRHTAAGRHRGADPRPWVSPKVRGRGEAHRRLVLHRRRRLPRGHLDDEALSADVA